MAQKNKKNKGLDNPLQPIISHAKEYGFIFPSSEIYGGLQAVYDYGSNGAELKKNLKEVWWKAMTQFNQNVVGIDAAIFMHPTTWKASGHVDSFSDPMVDNKDSNKRYRVDVLLEDKANEYRKAGDDTRADSLEQELGRLMDADDMDGLRNLLISEEIKCAISGTDNWTEVRQFNLMFSTEMGSVADEANKIYLRPETAQGIFVNFMNVQKTSRQQIPFGIAQIGKAFRNEIVARQFVFRMREFEQMEMQFFVRPGEEMQWYDHWKQTRMKFLQAIGLPAEKLRFHNHIKLAHYANAAADIEFEFPIGFKELEGIHSRTDFDLSKHAEYSKTKIQYVDDTIEDKDKRKYIPYVVETSIGLDRLFLAVLANSLSTAEGIDAKGNTKTRTYLKIHPALAPNKVAVFPLLRKDGLPEIAKGIFNDLRHDFKTIYEERGAIGKLYTRQDMIGTPFCITVDHQTKEDNTVTVRERDTTEQKRVKIEDLHAMVAQKVSLRNIFDQLV
ncbi:MAG TPA: glycine--tRNA ligase [Microscillaceae bacterium]|nr:glycine--tRNA ligase [Microscillaceae bacterium]